MCERWNVRSRWPRVQLCCDNPDARVCLCDCPSYFHLSSFSILFTCCPSFTGQFSVSCICSLSNPFPNISAFLFPALIFMYFCYFVFFLCPVSGFRSFQMLTNTQNTYCNCRCLFNLIKEIKMRRWMTKTRLCSAVITFAAIKLY